MAYPISDEVHFLGNKLCAIMTELYSTTDLEESEEDVKALSEPWSLDMSGPFKYAGKSHHLNVCSPLSKRSFVVFDNESYVISEASSAEEASEQAGGSSPVFAGMNIMLYSSKHVVSKL